MYVRTQYIHSYIRTYVCMYLRTYVCTNEMHVTEKTRVENEFTLEKISEYYGFDCERFLCATTDTYVPTCKLPALSSCIPYTGKVSRSKTFVNS